ncbi:DNA repair protein RecO [Jannaschia sp. M317]|uniref:DNA repair protein RecO n=1 Tax=Jannaschia sp. M317 TaxID=2867011 RepID=UPI0021A8D803|nr:DNA repair protein RecO [Jannaschia sp. M317]UWQ17384.1 DNA repair protein RecO [Jannaschia sp. M317]
MIEWRDQGLLLAVRPHGETAVIAEVFTRAHGRHLGIIHGGRSRKKAAALQPGNDLAVTWRARLDSHLGTFAAEPLRTRAGDVLSDPLRLAGLTTTCALAAFVLPEREALPDFQARTDSLADALAEGAGWLRDYVFWEMALLAEAGLRLDLSACAAGGGANDLAYVSPRTGRAVSRTGAGAWADRLLPLPEMLLGGPATLPQVLSALDLTGHFLHHHLAPTLGDRPVPPARARLIDALRRAG